jgi:hypothetical protein
MHRYFINFVIFSFLAANAAYAGDVDVARGHIENAYLSLVRAEEQLAAANRAGGGGMDCEPALSDVRWIRRQVNLFLYPDGKPPDRAYNPSVDGQALGMGVNRITGKQR